MPEKYGLSAWGSVSVAVVLGGFVVLGTYLMKTQHQLEEAEIVLSRAKEETVRAKARAADLAKVIEALRTELKVANTARNELQGKLDKANAAIAGLSETLDTAQSNLGNKQSQLQAIKAKLTDAKHEADKLSAEAVESEKQITKLRQGTASCEEFFNEWEIRAAPVSFSVIAALGREAAAAKDCIDKGNVSTACKHWQGLLVEIEKIGPPVSESRSEIEQLMRQNRCETEGDASSN